MAHPLGKKIKDNLQALADAKVTIFPAGSTVPVGTIVGGSPVLVPTVVSVPTAVTGDLLGSNVDQTYTNAIGDAVEAYSGGTLLPPAPAILWNGTPYTLGTWAPAPDQLRPRVTLQWLVFSSSNPPYASVAWTGTASKILVKRKIHGESANAQTVATLTNMSLTSYVDDTGLFSAPGVPMVYDYTLQVVDNYGTLGDDTSVEAVTTQTYPSPTDPVDAIVASPGSGQIGLIYLGETDSAKVALVDRYILQQRKAPATPNGKGGYTVPVSPSWDAWVKINDTKALAMVVSGLSNSYVFQFRYQIVNVYGISSAWNTAVNTNLGSPILPEAPIDTSDNSRAYFVSVVNALFARQYNSPKNIRFHVGPSNVDPARLNTFWAGTNDGYIWYQTDLKTWVEWEYSSTSWQASPVQPVTSATVAGYIADAQMTSVEKGYLLNGNGDSGFKGLVAEKILFESFGTKFNPRFETDPAYQAYVSQFLTVERVLLNPLKGLLSNTGATSTGVTGEIVQELSRLEAVKRDLGYSLFATASATLTADTDQLHRSKLPWSTTDTIDGLSFYAYVLSVAPGLKKVAVKTASSSPSGNTTGDLWVNSTTHAVSRWTGSAWTGITVSNSFLALEQSAGQTRTLFAVANFAGLPTAYTLKDAMVTLIDITASSKVFSSLEIHIATQTRSSGGFTSSEWAPASLLHSDPAGSRSIGLFATTGQAYVSGDIFVPGSNSTVVSGTSGDSILFSSGNFYSSSVASTGSTFNADQWLTHQTVGDASTAQTVEKIVSQFTSNDVASILEKNSLSMQWNAIKAQETGLVARATSYGLSSASLASAYSVLVALFDTNPTGVLFDLTTVTIRAGLWDSIKTAIQAWNLAAQSLQTGIDGIITDITAPILSDITLTALTLTYDATNALVATSAGGYIRQNADGSVRLLLPTGIIDNPGGSGVKGVKVYRYTTSHAETVADKIGVGNVSYLAPYIFDDQGVESGTSNVYGFSVYDRNQNESAIVWSTGNTAITPNDTRPPADVGSISASISNGITTISWSKVAGYYVSGYVVEFSANGTFSDTVPLTPISETTELSLTYGGAFLDSSGTATDGTLLASVANWRFRVKAKTVFSVVSTGWKATTTAPDTSNLFPPNVASIIVSAHDGYVTVSWSSPALPQGSSTQNISYLIQKSTNSGGSWGAASPLTDSTFDDKSVGLALLSDFSAWRFRVKTKYGFGAVSSTWIGGTTTPDYTNFFPPVVTGISASTGSDGKVVLTWPSPGVSKTFLVEKSTNSGGSWGTAFEVPSATWTEPSVEASLATLQTLRFRITGKSSWGSLSSVAGVTTASASTSVSTTDFVPPTVAGQYAVSNANGLYVLTWNAAGGRTAKYLVEKSLLGNFSDTTSLYVTNPTWTDPTLPTVGNYTTILYRISSETSYAIQQASPSTMTQSASVQTTPNVFNGFFRPADETALSAAMLSVGFSVKWGIVDRGATYRLQRKIGGGAYADVAGTSGGVTTQNNFFTDVISERDASVLATYRYQVIGKTSYGIEALNFFGDTQTPTFVDFQPAMPTNIGAELVNTQVRVFWTNPGGNATSFTVQKSTNGGSTWTSLTTTTYNEFFDGNGIVSVASFRYRIRSNADSGAFSAWVSTAADPNTTFTTPYSVASGSVKAKAIPGFVSVTWDRPSANTTFDRYYVEKSLDSGSTWGAINTIHDPSDPTGGTFSALATSANPDSANHYHVLVVSDTFFNEPIGIVEASTMSAWRYRVLALSSALGYASAYGTGASAPNVSGYGTYIPSALTGLKVVEAGRTLSLGWTNPNNLLGFIRYEAQVSKDQTNWYSLQTDGTDWKGTLNSVTPSTGFFTHTKVPLFAGDGVSGDNGPTGTVGVLSSTTFAWSKDSTVSMLPGGYYRKDSGSSWSDARLYTNSGFAQAYVSGRPLGTSAVDNAMIALTSSPSTLPDWTSLDAAWYFSAGSCWAVRLGTWYRVDTGATTTAGTNGQPCNINDRFTVVSNGTTIVWYWNGIAKLTLVVSLGTMKGCWTASVSGGIITDIKFGDLTNPGPIYPLKSSVVTNQFYRVRIVTSVTTSSWSSTVVGTARPYDLSDLTVENLKVGATATILDIVGGKIYTGKATDTNLSTHPTGEQVTPGNYALTWIDLDGGRLRLGGLNAYMYYDGLGTFSFNSLALNLSSSDLTTNDSMAWFKHGSRSLSWFPWTGAGNVASDTIAGKVTAEISTTPDIKKLTLQRNTTTEKGVIIGSDWGSGSRLIVSKEVSTRPTVLKSSSNVTVTKTFASGSTFSDTGFVVTKVGGSGGWNESAWSDLPVYGPCHVVVKVGTVQDFIIGLTTINPTAITSYTDIPYGMQVQTGTYNQLQSGAVVSPSSAVPPAVGDLVEIIYTGSQVQWWAQSGLLFVVNLTKPLDLPLYFKASINTNTTPSFTVVSFEPWSASTQAIKGLPNSRNSLLMESYKESSEIQFNRSYQSLESTTAIVPASQITGAYSFDDVVTVDNGKPLPDSGFTVSGSSGGTWANGVFTSSGTGWGTSRLTSKVGIGAGATASYTVVDPTKHIMFGLGRAPNTGLTGGVYYSNINYIAYLNGAGQITEYLGAAIQAVIGTVVAGDTVIVNYDGTSIIYKKISGGTTTQLSTRSAIGTGFTFYLDSDWYDPSTVTSTIKFYAQNFNNFAFPITSLTDGVGTWIANTATTLSVENGKLKANYAGYASANGVSFGSSGPTWSGAAVRAKFTSTVPITSVGYYNGAVLSLPANNLFFIDKFTVVVSVPAWPGTLNNYFYINYSAGATPASVLWMEYFFLGGILSSGLVKDTGLSGLDLYNNGALPVSGVTGNALFFSGGSVSKITSLYQRTGSVAMSVHFRMYVPLAGTGTVQTVLGNFDHGGYNWRVFISTTGTLYFHNTSTAYAVQSGVWTDVIITVTTAGAWTLYINGVYSNSGTGITYGGAASELILGNNGLNTTAEYFYGAIDDLQILNDVVLTLSQAQFIANPVNAGFLNSASIAQADMVLGRLTSKNASLPTEFVLTYKGPSAGGFTNNVLEVRKNDTPVALFDENGNLGLGHYSFFKASTFDPTLGGAGGGGGSNSNYLMVGGRNTLSTGFGQLTLLSTSAVSNLASGNISGQINFSTLNNGAVSGLNLYNTVGSIQTQLSGVGGGAGFGGTMLFRLKDDNANTITTRLTLGSLVSTFQGALRMSGLVGQYTLASVDASTSPIAVEGFLGVNAGDQIIRSFWGISLDINAGNLGDSTSAANARINSTSSFTINTRTDTNTFKTLFTVRNSGNVLVGSLINKARLSVASPDVGSVPALGASSGIQFLLSNSDGNGYGLLAGTLTSGTSYITSQRVDGTATAYNLLLQPNGGNVLVGTIYNPLYGNLFIASTAGDKTDATLRSVYAFGTKETTINGFGMYGWVKGGASNAVRFAGFQTSELGLFDTGTLVLQHNGGGVSIGGTGTPISAAEKLHVIGNVRVDDASANAGFKMSFDNTSKTLNFIYVGA